jgi:hypothetical protein
MLLDGGADPNVYFTDGENQFTPLTGALGEGERSPTSLPPHPQAEAPASSLRKTVSMRNASNRNSGDAERAQAYFL